jgi:hypothetical protein
MTLNEIRFVIAIKFSKRSVVFHIFQLTIVFFLYTMEWYTLRVDDQVFGAYIFWASMLVVKMLLMVLLTGIQRFRKKVGNVSPPFKSK